MSTETLTPQRSGGDEPRPPGETGGIQRGSTLGRYTVLEAIGSGGMGNVFAAWDPELQRRVAVKVLHGDLRSSSKRKAQERLRLEAQAAARLAHPNVVTIYDVGTVGDRLFIAMELVEGQTLKAWSREARPWRQTLEIYRQAARGLAAAHRAGLVHRDFKPGNVMLAEDGQVKILDFGLAKAVGPELEEGRTPQADHIAPGEHAASKPEMTRTGQRLGTPRYMSPEQVLGQAVDSRSDQFSFCVSLYESLYGCRPFLGDGDGPTGPPLVAGKLREPPQDSEVPTRVRLALERGLKADPEQRYPSLDALLEDLEVESSARRRLWIAAVVLVAPVIPAYLAMRAPAVDCMASGRAARGR